MTVNCDSRLVIRMSLQMRNSLTQAAEAGLVAQTSIELGSSTSACGFFW
jgi:hypothetical protein